MHGSLKQAKKKKKEKNFFLEICLWDCFQHLQHIWAQIVFIIFSCRVLKRTFTTIQSISFCCFLQKLRFRYHLVVVCKFWDTRKHQRPRQPTAGGDGDRAVATNLTCDKTLALFDFPSLGTCPADPEAHLLASRWPQTPTTHVQDQKRPWHARSENTAYFSISLWCALSKTFLLLYSADQRLLLFLLLLLIFFCSLITQSSLTMTLMLMRRWRGCFNELQSTSEELRRVSERE